MVRGFIGDIPKTAWVVDYPLFERLHYLFVAGFNVYETTGHQLASRKYMDYLRMDGENNFLRFMPKSARQEMHDDWYQGVIPNLTKLYEEPLFSIDKETGIEYQTQNYKREFLVKFKAK